MTIAAAGSDAIALRRAQADDIPALEALIARSARALGEGFYTARETEAAIGHVFGVDSDLIADGSYLIAVTPGRAIAGCGGWSRRRTLFGGDRFATRDSGWLDPAIDAARIRAFFVAPEQARRGVGGRLLDACEAAAAAHGFTRAALMATLPGVPFYAARGYRANAAIEHDCGDLRIRFVPMEKQL